MHIAKVLTLFAAVLLFSSGTIAASAMHIPNLPKAAKKLYERYPKSRSKITHWNRGFKNLTDDQLIRTIKAIVESTEPQHHNVWKFVGIAFNELFVRGWSKDNRDLMETWRTQLTARSQHCFSTHAYAVETAGILIRTNGKRKVIHPYSFDELTKNIFWAWEDSPLKVSFEEYLENHVDPELVKEVQTRTITYLTSKERDKYRVTYDKEGLKIGGKKPKDGWYMYVLGGKPLSLFAAKKEKGKLHHTSFLKGIPVPSAGEIEVYKGEIDCIYMRSGHYRPTVEDGERLRKFLEQPEYLGKKAARLEVIPHQSEP